MALTKQRGYGLDMLRILSMLLVVILHLMGAGAVLYPLTPGSMRYAAAWCLELTASCAVNCYGLLSGYVGYGHGHPPKKLAALWLQVFFFSVVLSWGVGFYFQGNLTLKELIYPCFPVLTVQYWYFTAYFGLYLLMPYLDRMLAGLDGKQASRLMLLLAGLFSVLPLLATQDLFTTSGGYTLLWLVVLYLLGACVKKCEPIERRPSWQYALGFAACIALSLTVKLLDGPISALLPSDLPMTTRLVSYTSPFLLGAAAMLLLLFRQWDVKNPLGRKLIAFFAPVSFGVYIIHTNPKVWTHLLAARLLWVAELPAPLLLLTVVGIALAVFLGCALLDFLRLKLFQFIGTLFRKKDPSHQEPVGRL